MFESFLSRDMTYSCAIFGEAEGGPTGDLLPKQRKIAAAKGVDELELAQMRKLRTIIARARLSKGDRVLEIGSGWGSLAIEVRLFTPFLCSTSAKSSRSIRLRIVDGSLTRCM